MEVIPIGLKEEMICSMIKIIKFDDYYHQSVFLFPSPLFFFEKTIKEKGEFKKLKCL